MEIGPNTQLPYIKINNKHKFHNNIKKINNKLLLFLYTNMNSISKKQLNNSILILSNEKDLKLNKIIKK